MIRSGVKADAKRKRIDYKKTQFANAVWKEHDYPFRLSIYDVPPTAEISLEDFETWAIDRLRVLAEIESCSFRNKSPQETAAHLEPILKKYLPLSANSAATGGSLDQRLKDERRKDHYSHFILRLAFSGTEDLRRRFARVETMLFRLRYQQDDGRERRGFVDSLNLSWDVVAEEEKMELSDQLMAATPGLKRLEEESWFKVDWTRVPELVEHRNVLVKKGKAYVPMKEQTSMVMTEFSNRLDRALELTARAIPRLDEDDRLSPILNHLSKNFAAPDAAFSESDSSLSGAPISAANIDGLSQHFPLCMKHLHTTLRKNNHLKHFGRLQYTLFLKGLGLTMEDCLMFWRQSFKNITDDTFNKEYRYNIRHSYGDVGGDANRRGRGYSPYSCQKILTEHPLAQAKLMDVHIDTLVLTILPACFKLPEYTTEMYSAVSKRMLKRKDFILHAIGFSNGHTKLKSKKSKMKTCGDLQNLTRSFTLTHISKDHTYSKIWGVFLGKK